MGTRNLTIVYYKGQYRIVQYGQYDGYPSGQGTTVLEFLQDSENITKLRTALDAGDTLIFEIKRGDDSDARLGDHPALSNLTGAKILTLATEATEKTPMPVMLSMGSIIDCIFIEWTWVVDLDNDTFECYSGHVGPNHRSTSTSRFRDVLRTYDPVPKLRGSWHFDQLPVDRADLVNKVRQGFSSPDEAHLHY